MRKKSKPKGLKNHLTVPARAQITVTLPGEAGAAYMHYATLRRLSFPSCPKRARIIAVDVITLPPKKAARRKR